MTKHECLKNDEARMTNGQMLALRHSSFVIRHSGFIRHSLLDIRHSVSVPFVLGTPGIRGSGSTAMRSERAVDLNTASLM